MSECKECDGTGISPVVAPEQAAPELPRAWALSVTAPDAKGSMECLWFGNDDNGMKRHLFTADQMHAFRAEGIAAALAARQDGNLEDWKRRALEAEFALGTGAARQARASIPPATAQSDSVPVPQNADQARMMIRLGSAWLESYGPVFRPAAATIPAALLPLLEQQPAKVE